MLSTLEGENTINNNNRARNFNRSGCTGFFFRSLLFLSFYFVIFFSSSPCSSSSIVCAYVCLRALSLTPSSHWLWIIFVICGVPCVRILNANKCSFFLTMWHEKLVSMLSHSRQHHGDGAAWSARFSLWIFLFVSFCFFSHFPLYWVNSTVDMQVPDQIIKVYTCWHARKYPQPK